jgi:hypothetical protein
LALLTQLPYLRKEPLHFNLDRVRFLLSVLKFGNRKIEAVIAFSLRLNHRHPRLVFGVQINMADQRRQFGQAHGTP